MTFCTRVSLETNPQMLKAHESLKRTFPPQLLKCFLTLMRKRREREEEEGERKRELEEKNEL